MFYLFLQLFSKDIGVAFWHNCEEPYNHTRGKILSNFIKMLRFELFRVIIFIFFRSKYFTKKLNKIFDVNDREPRLQIQGINKVTLGHKYMLTCQDIQVSMNFICFRAFILKIIVFETY